MQSRDFHCLKNTSLSSVHQAQATKTPTVPMQLQLIKRLF